MHFLYIVVLYIKRLGLVNNTVSIYVCVIYELTYESWFVSLYELLGL